MGSRWSPQHVKRPLTEAAPQVGIGRRRAFVSKTAGQLTVAKRRYVGGATRTRSAGGPAPGRVLPLDRVRRGRVEEVEAAGVDEELHAATRGHRRAGGHARDA